MGRLSIAVLVLAAVVRADAVHDLADKVLAGEVEAAKAQAWPVADELCARGEHDAAQRFAEALDQPRLAKYVASRRGKKPSAALRAAVVEARKAMVKRDFKTMVAILEGVTPNEDDVISVRVLSGRASAHQVQRQLKRSIPLWRRVAVVARRCGWTERVDLALTRVASLSLGVEDWKAAEGALTEILALHEGNAAGRARAAGLFEELALRHERAGRQTMGAPLRARAAVVYASLGKWVEAGNARNSEGTALSRAGQHVTARRAYRAAIACYEKGGSTVGLCSAALNIGGTFLVEGATDRASEFYGRALDLARANGLHKHEGVALQRMARVHWARGDYRAALAVQESALAIHRRGEHRDEEAATLEAMATSHERAGAYGKALAHVERALAIYRELKDENGVADALGLLATIHSNLGQVTKAVAYYDRAIAIDRKLGNRASLVARSGNLALAYYRLGEYEKARALQVETLRHNEEIGDRNGTAIALVNLSLTHARLDELDKAIALQRRALALHEELGNQRGVAVAHGNLGEFLGAQGDLDAAAAHLEKGADLAGEIEARFHYVFNLQRLAYVYLAQNRPEAAVKAARRGVDAATAMVGGLGDSLGRLGRARHRGIFEVGALAAMQAGDVAVACYFIEAGRAGALLESLGGRERLARATLPAALREAEREARTVEAGAQDAYRSAVRGRKRKDVKAARDALAKARADRKEVIARIQREAQAAADVVYQEPASLAKISTGLRAGEALVSYAMIARRPTALLITRDEARLVPLELAPFKLRLSDTARDAAPVLAKLRAMLIEPLGLPEDCERLIVSPHASLLAVPFAAIAGGRDVVYVPSATTYGVLDSGRGEGVLAFGDPTYRRLARLPGSGAEAKAIGDTVRLGDDATTARFRDDAAARQWRAVHLACHAVFDAKESRLVLAGDEALTTLDVFGMRVRADLVVLSACATAKGLAYRGQSAVGFTRAFMLAGAPRVIVSLWKVDDEATQALMVKFYELWSKKPTATALRLAQEHVRAQKKWAHPYYWAAWQLWGLGD